MALKPTRSDADTTTKAAPGQEFEAVAVDVNTIGKAIEPRLTSQDVNNPREPFVYFISASEYQLIRGVFLPRPKKVYTTKGLGYVGPKGELSNMLNYQETLGRMLVPTRTPVTAWGREVTGYVRAHETTFGHKHHTSVWERYRKVGRRVVWEKDEDGYFEFCKMCHALLNPGGVDVDPVVAQNAIKGIMAEIAYLDTLPPYNSTAQRRKDYLLSLLPDEKPTKEAAKSKN